MVSAYVILHHDDDHLERALRSVEAVVDEVVVVDGAYAWVAPFLAASGLDPERSGPRTHEILARLGPRVRYFQGTWENELQKRRFGFAQCSGDFVMRLDTDELFQWNEGAVRAFCDSRSSVGEMEFPLLLGPGVHRQPTRSASVPRQAFFFRRSEISAETHCDYLWLVLPSKEQAERRAPDWTRRFPQPLARTAHLSSLRTLETARNRARFYVLNYVRGAGRVPWTGRGLAEGLDASSWAQAVGEGLGEGKLSSWLEGHEIVSGFPNMKDHALEPLAFDVGISEYVAHATDAYLQSVDLVRSTQGAGRVLISGQPSHFDVTLRARAGGRRFTFEAEAELSSFQCELLVLGAPGEPLRREPAAVTHQGRCHRVELGGVLAPDVVRAVLVVTARRPAGQPLSFRVGARGEPA